MSSHSRRTLFVFLDESGNLDFSPKGTDHFVMAAVYTMNPAETAAKMQELKYELLSAGSDDLDFHATNNSRGTRRRVRTTIQSMVDQIGVKTMYIDKHYAAPSVQKSVRVMEIFGKAFARWLAYSPNLISGVDQVVMVFDSVLVGKEREAFLKAVKPSLKTLGILFRVAFHPVKSDLNGQIADYFAWSLFRSLESGDTEPLAELSAFDFKPFDLFVNGHTRYY